MNGHLESQQTVDVNHTEAGDNGSAAANHASLDDSVLNSARADNTQHGFTNGTHAHKQIKAAQANEAKSMTQTDHGFVVGNATKPDQQTGDKENVKDADQSKRSQVDKILQRRISGRMHKYRVKFTDGSILWLTPAQVDPIKLSEFNVRQYKLKQAKKQRKLLSYNQ
jgi:hypothetical protein